MNEHLKAQCPCGSGKPYVECCLSRHLARGRENPARVFNEEIQKLVSGRNFDSIEAMNEFVRAYCDKRNAAPQADFLGLSSHQVHMMMDFPFEGTDDLVRLNESIAREDFASSPIVEDAVFFLGAMAENGPVKATAKGNLGREFAKRMFDEIDHSGLKKDIKFRREEDSMAVQSLRLILTLGGWIRKSKGSFRLTRRGEKSVKNGFSTEDFLRLFWTFTGKFNWAFQDGYQEFVIIQRAYLFSLLLVHRKARAPVDDFNLAPHFVRAFPVVLTEAERLPYDPFGEVGRCFSLRFLERFCAYFGLIETEPKSDDPFERRFRFRTSPLFDKLLIWKI